MKILVRLLMLAWLFELAVFPSQAAFSSLYAFGDGICTTTDNAYWDPSYYPKTYSNGRIWLQVLAQRQGLTYDETKNVSYFGNDSVELVNEVNSFTAPTNALVAVWVIDADVVNYMLTNYPNLDPGIWNAMVSRSLANHQTAIQTLYAKGARTLIMPNAVDITKTPQYSGLVASDRTTIRQRIAGFNSSFTTILNQSMASRPGLKISMPDMFALLDNMVARPGDYGLVNATGGAYATYDGYSTWNGPRNNWLWWDPWDPTAMAHEIIADVAQASASPARVTNVTSLVGSNRLSLANVPIGLNGFVDGRTNLVLGNWMQLTNFNSTSATQSVYVRSSGPRWYYRLRFPFAWSWP